MMQNGSVIIIDVNFHHVWYCILWLGIVAVKYINKINSPPMYTRKINIASHEDLSVAIVNVPNIDRRRIPHPNDRGVWADRIINDKRIVNEIMVIIVILWSGAPSIEFKVLCAVITLDHMVRLV